MVIKVLRKWYSNKSTIGIGSIDGIKWGYTLEDVARPVGVKVHGQTAIPAGSYKVILDYSNRFKKIMPHILDVPGFEGVRIHGGNKAEDTEGCILVGLRRGPDTIWDCKSVYESIVKSMTEAKQRGEEVTIDIVNQANLGV